MTTFVSIFTIKMYDLYFLDKQQDGWDSQHESQNGNLDRDKGVKDERNGDRGMLRVQTNRTATSTEIRE